MRRPVFPPPARLVRLPTLFLVLVLASPPALADLASGNARYLHGDYPAAIKDYRAVKGKDAPRATVNLGRALLRTGDLAGAEKAARAASRATDRAVAADASVLLAEVYRTTGRLAEARDLLVKTTRANPKHLRARSQLGLVHRELGDDAAARPVFESFIDAFNDGTIDEKNAEGLLYVAIATKNLNAYQDANDAFRDAVIADATLLEANVEWGWVLLEKYAAGDAEEAFDDVLKIDPNHPDAHAGMARVKLEQGYDVTGALEHVDKALAVNPRHASALAIRAEIEMDNQQYAEAGKTLGLILAANPADNLARSMRAAIRWLQDDRAGFEAEKKAILGTNPRYARLYHVVADFAVKEHRYVEAIELEGEALKLDPSFYAAEAAIGIGYLRLGEEDKGLAHLRRAYDDDPFNVRVYNTLKLFEEWIPRDYVFFKSRSFRFRSTKTERPLLERYIPRTLERAFADMAKRYRFTPHVPVTIELYANPDQYSVRTIGLPNLGALGVCFGRIITALSPANGNVSWGMVLWHELGHVFAIQLSSSRVPRWFTEGLSEYETLVARKEWRRENDADLWVALEEGSLPSVADLNAMFTRARNMQDMVVAYHLSSVAVEFMVQRWGFPKIVEALKLFGQGKDTPAVLRAVTGLDVPAFDAAFRAYLEKRLAVYQGTFAVRLSKYSDLTALEQAADAAPGSADAAASVALGAIAADELDKAAIAAARALTLDPRNRKALWAQADLALKRGDLAGGRARLEALIAAGGDGYDARLRLAHIALQQKDKVVAERELVKATKLDPERSEPHGMLAELYAGQDRQDEALAELERYAYIEQMEYAPMKKLVDKYSLRKQWGKVAEFGEMALFVAPGDPDLHLALGAAYLALKRPADARWEYESALLCDPPPRRPALAHLGLAKANQARRDVAGARRAIRKALELEPKNAEAKALEKKLR